MCQRHLGRRWSQRALQILPDHCNDEYSLCEYSSLRQRESKDPYKALGTPVLLLLVLFVRWICRRTRRHDYQSVGRSQNASADPRDSTFVLETAKSLGKLDEQYLVVSGRMLQQNK